ncbi:hypothetical protein [Vibrio diabolicus]|uniref:hypothetical protein n=1 Tax=Vibrio diabolicus TaxID=50719 RepID=UPI000AB0A5BC
MLPITKLIPIAKNNGPEVRAKIVVAPEIPFTAIAAIADEIPNFRMSLVIVPNKLSNVDLFFSEKKCSIALKELTSTIVIIVPLLIDWIALFGPTAKLVIVGVGA